MSTYGDYEAVRQSIVKLLEQPEYDDGSAGPVLVRLAWYDEHNPLPATWLISTRQALLRYIRRRDRHRWLKRGWHAI